jgi:hypothetical protein
MRPFTDTRAITLAEAPQSLIHCLFVPHIVPQMCIVRIVSIIHLGQESTRGVKRSPFLHHLAGLVGPRCGGMAEFVLGN